MERREEWSEEEEEEREPGGDLKYYSRAYCGPRDQGRKSGESNELQKQKSEYGHGDE